MLIETLLELNEVSYDELIGRLKSGVLEYIWSLQIYVSYILLPYVFGGASCSLAPKVSVFLEPSRAGHLGLSFRVELDERCAAGG